MFASSLFATSLAACLRNELACCHTRNETVFVPRVTLCTSLVVLNLICILLVVRRLLKHRFTSATECIKVVRIRPQIFHCCYKMNAEFLTTTFFVTAILDLHVLFSTLERSANS